MVDDTGSKKDEQAESASFEVHHLIGGLPVDGFTEEDFLERSEVVNLTKHEIYAIIDYYFRERYHQGVDHLQMGDSTRDHWDIGERIGYFAQFVDKDRVEMISGYYKAAFEEFKAEFLTDSDAENTD